MYKNDLTFDCFDLDNTEQLQDKQKVAWRELLP